MAWTFGQAGRPGRRVVTVTFVMSSAVEPRRPEGAGLAPVRVVFPLPVEIRTGDLRAGVTFTNPRPDSNLRSRLRRASLSLAASCGHMAPPTSLGRIWSGECARRAAPNTRSALYPGGFPAW